MINIKGSIRTLITQSPKFAFALLTVLMLSLGFGAMAGYKAHTWVAYDAAFCVSCHVHDYAQTSWAASVHNHTNTTCHDCHHQSIYANMKNGYNLAMGNFNSAELVSHVPAVTDKICLKCHASDTEDIFMDILGPMNQKQLSLVPKIDRAPLHLVHLKSESRDPSLKSTWQKSTADKGEAQEDPASAPPSVHAKDFHEFQEHEDKYQIQCRYCHGSDTNRAHQFQAQQQVCQTCHAAQDHEEHTHNATCIQCHGEQFIDPFAGKEGS
jgi:nitrate/TMAO reductase-like tetraheme cytochrome c subunit